MKPFAFAYLLSFLSITSSFGQTLPPSMVGDFTNERRNATYIRLSVQADGMASISNGNGNLTGRLERRETNGETLYVCEGNITNYDNRMTVAFRFDPVRHAYLIVGSGESLAKALDNQRIDDMNQGAPNSEASIESRDLRLLTPLVDSIPSDTNDIPIYLAGGYYNMADNFKGLGLTISTNGFASVFISVENITGTWKYHLVDRQPVVAVETYNPSSDTNTTLLFGFSFNRRSFHVLAITNSVENAIRQWRDTEKSNRKTETLLQTTNGVPTDVEIRLAKYPEWESRARSIRENTKRMRQAEADRLEREQSLYEKRLMEIREKPETILSLALKECEAPSPLKRIAENPAEARALSDALADATIPFKEATLIAFLKKEPWEKNHRLLGQLFARNELSASTRRALFPQIIETAKHLNMDAASQFILHRNTPLDLVKELRDTPGIPPEVMNAVKKRLEEK